MRYLTDRKRAVGRGSARSGTQHMWFMHVSSIALATMISNDLVMPLLLRRSGDHREAADVASRVLWIRRLAILLLALVAYGYYRGSNNDTMLATYGLMAFAAVAQFAPGLIGGLYWRGASRRGVEVGMVGAAQRAGLRELAGAGFQREAGIGAADVGNPAQVEAAFATLTAQWGRLDLLFNNAGIAAKAAP